MNPRAAASGRTAVALRPYAEQTVSFVAMAAHSGTVRVRNGDGQIIAEVPYTVAPAKVVNQSASVNSSSSGDRVGLSYSVGGVPQSAFDPRWNVNVNIGVTPAAGTVSGSVSISVNW